MFMCYAKETETLQNLFQLCQIFAKSFKVKLYLR